MTFDAPPVIDKVGTILLVFGNSAQDPGAIEAARSPRDVPIAELVRTCQSASNNNPKVMTLAVLLDLNSEFYGSRLLPDRETTTYLCDI
jgi:hypothetical protein